MATSKELHVDLTALHYHWVIPNHSDLLKRVTMKSAQRRKLLKLSIALPFMAYQSGRLLHAQELHQQKSHTNSEAKPALDSSGKDIFATISENRTLKIFTRCLKKTAFDKWLRADGPYTVFVSSDEAYKKVSYGRKLAVWTNIGLMKDILNFHIVEGQWTLENLKTVTSLPTMHGAELEVSHRQDGSVLVAGAVIDQNDISASNGMVHVIDEVIVPPKSNA